MTSNSLHVLIVGGGIGGLCLARGLKKAGVGVAVYERDRSSTDRLGGYRIHINPAGSRALHACLPPAAWEAFLATVGDPEGGFGFLSERLEELAVVEEDLMYPATIDPAERQYPVDRITLRRLLLSGLDGLVRFDKKFERYERTPEGRVTAYFADGTSATGDVLVGADGANSPVRRQYLPWAERTHTNATAVAFKLPLTERTRAWLPPRLAAGMNLIVAPEPWLLFTAVFDRGRDPAEALQGLVAEEELVGVEGDYVLCAFVARRDAYPDDLGDLDGVDLRRLVGGMIWGWHPDLRRLISESDPASAMVVPIMTSVPVDPWESTNVTLLGDAIHSMPPTGGVGGNMALRDANLLTRKLAAVGRGEASLTAAIGEYEAEMIDYGFAAVRASVENTRQGISEGRASLAAFKTILRVCRAVPPLKRLMFRNAWAEHARRRPWEQDVSQDPTQRAARSLPAG